MPHGVAHAQTTTDKPKANGSSHHSIYVRLNICNLCADRITYHVPIESQNTTPHTHTHCRCGRNFIEMAGEKTECSSETVWICFDSEWHIMSC